MVPQPIAIFEAVSRPQNRLLRRGPVFVLLHDDARRVRAPPRGLLQQGEGQRRWLQCCLYSVAAPVPAVRLRPRADRLQLQPFETRGQGRVARKAAE